MVDIMNNEFDNLEPLNEHNRERAYLMAIRGDLNLFIMNNKNSSRYKLSMGEINKIRSKCPDKEEIYLEAPLFNNNRQESFGYWQYVNYKDIWVDPSLIALPQANNTTLTAENSPYFMNLKTLVDKAIIQFPKLKKNRKLTKYGDVIPWIKEEITTDNRTAEIIKKALSDIFPDYF